MGDPSAVYIFTLSSQNGVKNPNLMLYGQAKRQRPHNDDDVLMTNTKEWYELKKHIT